jgi:peroxiredoxin
MKFLIPAILASLISIPTFARASVQEKLDHKKAEFTKAADAEKIADYEEGIKIVEESGVLKTAKNVGDVAPNFTLPNALGGTTTLSNLLNEGPVVLIWYRGEWCPYCNIYLKDIQDHAKDFKKIGAQIVAISPEVADNSVAMQDKLDLEFHVLSDEGSKTAKDYGVIYELPPKIANYLNNAFDLKTANNDDGNTLPLSASYVINPNGEITYAFLDADYRKRAETEVLLKEVEKITQKQK